MNTGFVVCSPSQPVHTVQVFEAQIAILEHKSIICPGYTCVLHAHTAIEEVTISAIVATIEKGTGKKKRGARFVKTGDNAIVRIEMLNGVICLEEYKKMQGLGRFTLRDEGMHYYFF